MSLKTSAWVLALLCATGVLVSDGPVMRAEAQSVSSYSSGFQDFKRELRQRAEQDGISAETLNAVMSDIEFQPRVIALDRAQPGAPPMALSRNLHLTGRSMLIMNGSAAGARAIRRCAPC